MTLAEVPNGTIGKDMAITKTGPTQVRAATENCKYIVAYRTILEVNPDQTPAITKVRGCTKIFASRELEVLQRLYG